MTDASKIVEVEVWKPIKGFEGLYDVSNFGKVKSLARKARLVPKGVETKRIVPLRILKQSCVNGYKRVRLCENGKVINYFVHRLVADAFIDNPFNKPCINHKDGDRKNNHFSNLEYVTHSENTQHAKRNGMLKPQRGEKCGASKLTEKEVIEARRIFSKGNITITSLASQYGIKRQGMTSIIKRKNWRHI